MGDVAHANVLALDYVQSDVGDAGSPDEMAFNIASGQATSVNALYDKMTKIIPAKIEAIHADARAGELMESRLDITRAGEVLGFSPKVNLPDGLLQTIQGQVSQSNTKM